MSLRIMVVDDSPVSRILITEMVREAGHQVVAEAETLAQALAAYQTHKPDVVTLDLSLANEDGRNILKALRGLDAQAQVVVISGNSQPKVIAEITAAGAAGYLTKPFDHDDILRALSRFPNA
jgi:two-component system, chemotaxis family, chemotaxis protein CheY